jgi:phage FluMu protein Com
MKNKPTKNRDEYGWELEVKCFFCGHEWIESGVEVLPKNIKCPKCNMLTTYKIPPHKS